MTQIFGQLLEQVYRETHADILDGVATGGTATTIVDTGLITRSFTENKFKGWIAFISSTTNGASPQSKYGIVTAYVKSSGTITIPTVTDAVESGDEYALCKPDIPLYTMIKLCNDAINDLFFVKVDTSLTTADNTVRYTLPIATKRLRPAEIYLRDPDDFSICETPNWGIDPAVPGSTETLHFKWQPATSKTIVIVYATEHPQLTTYSSSVSEKIHSRLAIAACVEAVYRWRVRQKQRPLDQKNWNMAKALLEEMKQKHPIEMPVWRKPRVPIGIYNT